MKTMCSVDGCTEPIYVRGWCMKHYSRWLRHNDPAGGRTPRGAPLEWLQQHRHFSDNECLIWPFHRRKTEYGKVIIEGKKTLATRLMCEWHHGPPPTPKHEAAHSCGRGSLGCVNPRHLNWKTRIENEADKIAHGTIKRGENHCLSKLTTADVLAIRATNGTPVKELAVQYGVGETTIRDVLKFRRWVSHRRVWPLRNRADKRLTHKRKRGRK